MQAKDSLLAQFVPYALEKDLYAMGGETEFSGETTIDSQGCTNGYVDEVIITENAPGEQEVFLIARHVSVCDGPCPPVPGGNG